MRVCALLTLYHAQAGGAGWLLVVDSVKQSGGELPTPSAAAGACA
jgi:hypothetical protein